MGCGAERRARLNGHRGLGPQLADQGDRVSARNESADSHRRAGFDERAHALLGHAGRTGNFFNRKDFVVGGPGGHDPHLGELRQLLGTSEIGH